MTEQEYLDSLPRTALTDKDRKTLKVGLIVSWIVSIAFSLFLGFVSFIIAKFFISTIFATFILVVFSAVGILIIQYIFKSKLSNPYKEDLIGGQKLTFSAILTNRRRSFDSNRENTFYYVKLDDVIELHCTLWDYQNLKDHVGKRVTGAIAPVSKSLISIEGEPYE